MAFPESLHYVKYKTNPLCENWKFVFSFLANFALMSTLLETIIRLYASLNFRYNTVLIIVWVLSGIIFLNLF